MAEEIPLFSVSKRPLRHKELWDLTLTCRTLTSSWVCSPARSWRSKAMAGQSLQGASFCRIPACPLRPGIFHRGGESALGRRPNQGRFIRSLGLTWSPYSDCSRLGLSPISVPCHWDYTQKTGQVQGWGKGGTDRRADTEREWEVDGGCRGRRKGPTPLHLSMHGPLFFQLPTQPLILLTEIA